MDKQESVYKTALLLVQHFSYCVERDGNGIHSRIFSRMLHPEEDYMAVGQSQAVIDGAKPYPEHVVPCATLINESFRLIKEGRPQEEIASLLAKHWKIVYISKEQANYLDTKKGLNLKYKMPNGWRLETGDTYKRLELANITIFPL